MKLNSPMLVVSDMDKSVKFYKKVLGLDVIMDFGANKTLTGGLALQTLETYKEFIVYKYIHTPLVHPYAVQFALASSHHSKTAYRLLPYSLQPR